MKSADKRDAVMQTTMELVAEHGFHGTPISLVAKRAGVSIGTIYHYFSGKQELIVQTYDRQEDYLLGAVAAGYPDDAPVRERFRHIGRTVMTCFLASPPLFRFFEQFHNSPYGVARRRDRILGTAADNVVTKLFEEGVKHGTIKELPATALFALAFGPLMQIVRDHIFGLIELDEPLIAGMVAACWDSIQR